MGFLVSPGVQVNEIDLTNIVPAVATSIAGISLPAEKGPVSEITSIGSEAELIDIFGKPNSNNFEQWFCAANFLGYGNALRVVRPASGLLNATVSGSGVLIKNDDDWTNNYASGQGSHQEWSARTAGTWGNSLGVSICASATAYEQNLGSSNQTVGEDAKGATVIAVDDGTAFQVGDLISFSSADASSDSTLFAFNANDEGNEYEITGISSNDLTVRLKDDPEAKGVQAIIPDNSFIRRRWRFYDLVDGAPGQTDWSKQNGRATNDEVHIVVYDTTGDLSGNDIDTAGNRTSAVLEVYKGLSKNPVAKNSTGASNYYVDVIFQQSKQILWGDHTSSGTNWGTDTTSSMDSITAPIVDTLSGGTDDYSVTVGEHQTAYEEFKDSETVDINLIIGGKTPDSASDGDTYGTMLIDIAEGRKDCVAFISPANADVVGVTSSVSQTANVKNFFDSLPSSSYVVFDSGYKYQYDKFNDVYRFVPLNGDIAGLCARTDFVADTWFSPAGYNRGQVRGAVKLAYNPTQSQRDELYRARINPVVNFPGQGVVLFGDKTGLTKPSAFDRINVRRLFITLEKAIATAAKFQLFEFNDEFTRAQFRNLVEPFLRDVQGRRGITDFSVVCDASNNTGEVVDRNEFVADIFIKPSRSINFITLNFIATRTGVAFSEIAG